VARSLDRAHRFINNSRADFAMHRSYHSGADCRSRTRSVTVRICWHETEAADVELAGADFGSMRLEAGARSARVMAEDQSDARPIEATADNCGWRGDLDANRLATPVEIDHQAVVRPSLSGSSSRPAVVTGSNTRERTSVERSPQVCVLISSSPTSGMRSPTNSSRRCSSGSTMTSQALPRCQSRSPSDPPRHPLGSQMLVQAFSPEIDLGEAAVLHPLEQMWAEFNCHSNHSGQSLFLAGDSLPRVGITAARAARHRSAWRNSSMIPTRPFPEWSSADIPFCALEPYQTNAQNWILPTPLLDAAKALSERVSSSTLAPHSIKSRRRARRLTTRSR